MKTGKIYLLILALVIIPFLIAGCSQGNTAFVTIDLSDSKHAAVEEKTILDRFMGLFVTKAMAKDWQLDKESLKVFVVGPGMAGIDIEIPPGSNTYTIEVPAGDDRRITVISYNARDLRNSGGHVVTDLNDGVEVTLTIDMLPITEITNIFGSTNPEIYILGYAAGNGYKIYRSESKDGPYKVVYTTTSTIWPDTTISFQPGDKYYYKVSVLTNKGEGELSNYRAWDSGGK